MITPQTGTWEEATMTEFKERRGSQFVPTKGFGLAEIKTEGEALRCGKCGFLYRLHSIPYGTYHPTGCPGRRNDAGEDDE